MLLTLLQELVQLHQLCGLCWPGLQKRHDLSHCHRNELQPVNLIYKYRFCCFPLSISFFFSLLQIVSPPRKFFFANTEVSSYSAIFTDRLFVSMTWINFDTTAVNSVLSILLKGWKLLTHRALLLLKSNFSTYFQPQRSLKMKFSFRQACRSPWRASSFPSLSLHSAGMPA